MLKKSFLTAAVLVSFAFAAVLRADIVDEIIARVNDAIITKADYEKARQNAQSELQQQSPGNWQAKWEERQKDTLRELIDLHLLLDKGKELGISGDTEVVKRLNQMRQQMGLKTMEELEEEAKKQGVSFEDFKDQIRTGAINEQVISREVGSHIYGHITNEEVQDFYNKHQKELEGAEEVSLSEILISTQPKPPAESKDQPTPAAAQTEEDPAKVAAAEAKAKSLLDQLRKGAKFEEIVKHSDGPTAAEGGRLGTFKRGELAKEFEEKTFALKPGEYTDVIRTRQGFLILKVNNRRAAGVPPLKDVEENIKQAIYSQKLEPAVRAYLTKLREQAYIDVKAGYVDTGASPNQTNKPVLVAASGNAPTKTHGPGKKKKKFLVF
jgi:peptidyl-prolyl cis-trans isomerase SurA